MTDEPKDNVIQFPTKKKNKYTPTIVTFTPEDFGVNPEIKEFTFDLDGMKGLIENPDPKTSEMFNQFPPEVLDKIFADVRKEVGKEDNISKVHDACFEVSLLAEQYPEHAQYIETRIHQLVKSLLLYVTNHKKG